MGVSQTTGAVIDTQGKSCVTVTTCFLLGPMVEAYTHAGSSVSTGVLSPGSRGWQLTATGNATIGTEGSIGGSANSDGSFTVGGDLSAGAGIGAALKLCSKKNNE